MEEEAVVQIIKLFEVFKDYLSILTVPAAGILVAFMEALKKWDAKDKLKKWYMYIAPGASAILAIAITLIGGYGWMPLLLHFGFIYFGELSVSMGIIKPILNFIKPLLKKKAP